MGQHCEREPGLTERLTEFLAQICDRKEKKKKERENIRNTRQFMGRDGASGVLASRFKTEERGGSRPRVLLVLPI